MYEKFCLRNYCIAVWDTFQVVFQVICLLSSKFRLCLSSSLAYTPLLWLQGTDGSVTYVQPQGQYCPLVTQQAGGTQQIFPVPTAAISTPPDPHLSVFLAEMRTQNLEVRMGVAKAVDKVDLVLMKVS